jgi:hypothetical protein
VLSVFGSDEIFGSKSLTLFWRAEIFELSCWCSTVLGVLVVVWSDDGTAFFLVASAVLSAMSDAIGEKERFTFLDAEMFKMPVGLGLET